MTTKMAANKLRLNWLKLFSSHNISVSHRLPLKVYYCTNKTSEDEELKNVSRFAEFYKKEVEIKEEIMTPQEPAQSSETFAAMLRKSKFIDLGDPEGKEVIGEIYHVVGDDLYIDFGWKFPTVCTAPKHNRKLYLKGTKVRLLIKELELSTKFLGSNAETTLLEADCLLLGLARRNVQVND